MHVAPSDRARAFRKLITLLKPGGLLAITLRTGPAEPERGFHPVSQDEVRRLTRDHGAFVERQSRAEDHLGRSDVQWTHLAIRLPDDGTGALPLLRHIILNDDKSSTYKLGLLRTLCRIADGAAGVAGSADDDHVAIPMGLVALTWIRLYKPLLAADLPQNPSNRGCDRLGFAKSAFRKLGAVSHHDLRVGMQFTGDTGTALHQAIKDAARTVVQMPVRYMTYPNGTRPILPVRGPLTALRAPGGIRLDEPYLASFGTMRVPAHLWAAIQRFSAWIEPAILAEWIRVTQRYAATQGRALDEARLAAAMTWSDPSRDVRIPRERAEQLLTAATSPLRVERKAAVRRQPRHRSLLPLDRLALRRPLESDARPPNGQSASRNATGCRPTHCCEPRRSGFSTGGTQRIERTRTIRWRSASRWRRR